MLESTETDDVREKSAYQRSPGSIRGLHIWRVSQGGNVLPSSLVRGSYLDRDFRIAQPREGAIAIPQILYRRLCEHHGRTRHRVRLEVQPKSFVEHHPREYVVQLRHSHDAKVRSVQVSDEFNTGLSESEGYEPGDDIGVGLQSWSSLR